MLVLTLAGSPGPWVPISGTGLPVPGPSRCWPLPAAAVDVPPGVLAELPLGSQRVLFSLPKGPGATLGPLAGRASAAVVRLARGLCCLLSMATVS